VRRSLRWIDPKDLAGIEYVELIDKLPEVKATSPDWYKQARTTERGINAWYKQETEDYCAGIVLHMPDLCFGIPKILWWTTVPTLLITKVLAHEVAHHLRRTRGYIFFKGESVKGDRHEEAAANHYAFDLIASMNQKWLYRLGHRLIHFASQNYYRRGVKKWNQKNYEEAALCWKKAREINPDHRYAAHWYWRAVEMLEAGQHHSERSQT